jgi:hypothetical protein
MLYRIRRGIIEGRTCGRLKHLKRKENAPIVSFEFGLAPAEADVATNRAMLAARENGSHAVAELVLHVIGWEIAGFG